MNKRQIDKVTNYQQLKLIFEDPLYKSHWTGRVALSAAVNRFYGSLNVLAGLAQVQGLSLTGVTVDKERLQASVRSRTLMVAGAVAAWASVTDNRTVFDAADLDPSDLHNLRDAELSDVAQAQHDLAQEHLAALADYGVTAEMLADLQSAIDAYEPLVGKPRTERAKRKTATDAVPDEIRRADKMLEEQIDQLMRGVEPVAPEFVEAYRNVRNIAQSGGSTEEEEPENPPMG